MKARKELVLYYTPEKSDMDRVIKSVLVRMGVRIRNIDGTQLGKAVGFLAGVPGVPEAPEMSDDAQKNRDVSELPEKMLVFCGFGKGKINRTLQEFRRAKVPQEVMKAALTMSNSGWSFARLYFELTAERDMMSGDADGSTGEA